MKREQSADYRDGADDATPAERVIIDQSNDPGEHADGPKADGTAGWPSREYASNDEFTSAMDAAGCDQ